MFEIKEVSDVQLAFPANVDEYIPLMEDIPEKFKNDTGDASKWIRLVALLFYGDSRNAEIYLTPKEGIDPQKAARHIKCVLGSFAPKHEHKMAGGSYLFSEWFEDWGYET